MKSVFRKVGLSLPIDGSADHEPDIKGFSGIDIGDWSAGIDENHSDLQYADVDKGHDYLDFVEYVADSE